MISYAMSAALLPLVALLLSAPLVTPLSTPLLQAALSGHADDVKKALHQDPSALRAVDDNQRTALALASAFNPDPAVAQALINAGSDLEARDVHGKTPLMLAAQFNTVQVVNLLLAAGADPRARDLKHRTAADAADRNPLVSWTPTYWKLYRLQYRGFP